jgi:hypothetical protein
MSMLHVNMSGRHVASINKQDKAADGHRPEVPWLLLFADGRVRRFGTQGEAKTEARKLWAPVTFTRH